jgi:hypothetical protein
VKTFSPEMEICRQSRSHDVAWLAELDWDNEVGRYSSRPVSVGGTAYRPILAAIQGLRLLMPSAIPDGGAGGGAVKLELVNTFEEGSERFELKADGQNLEGRTVRLGFIFLDPALVLTPGDIIWIQTYQIEAVVLGSDKAVLQLRESPMLAGRRLIGRTLLPTLDPALSAVAAGRMIPLVFGRIERSPLIPFRVGRRGYLRLALQGEDRTVSVEDASVFPDVGTVQIDDERLTYVVVDRVNRTLGRSDSPVVRTAPARHHAGSAVDWIPENGFEYLVADHPCHSVGPIYAGERVVDPTWYSRVTEQLGGRTVEKVVFPLLPSEIAYGSTAQTRRIDGREDENRWGAGAGNGAESPLSAVDAGSQATSAVLAAGKTPLEIEYRGDLSVGASIYGAMTRCRLAVDFSASERWSVANEITVEVGRGGDSHSMILNRPPLSENQMTFPAHSHADTIRDLLADTRDLFEIAQQSLVVNFDQATAPGGGWTECGRAIDNDLGSLSQNTTAGGPRVTSPLALRLLRRPLGSSAAAGLEAIEFRAHLATDEGAGILAALDATIAGKYVNSWTVQAGPTPQSFVCAITASGLTVEDLTAGGTEFAIRSLDGRQVKVFGAWLVLKYRPLVAGSGRTAAQWRSGAVEAASPVPVLLPTKSYRQEFDLTEFVQAHGGWAFFAPQSSERPYVRVGFGADDDPTEVRISAIGFEVEYTPRTGVEVFDRFEATVEGIAQAGELIVNPADIIQWLVTNEAGLGWEVETLDQASFTATRAWLEARGWHLSRRLGVALPAFSLLEGVAQESGCRLYWEAGRLRLRPLPTILLASDAAATLDSSLILTAPLARRSTSLGDICDVVRLGYGAGYSLSGAERQSDRKRWVEVAGPGVGAGASERSERVFRAHWHASSPPEIAVRLAALWLAQTNQPRRTIELNLPISQAHLERGDIALVHHPASRLDYAVGEIASVEFVDGRYVRATVVLQSLAPYCWYEDAETFISHLAGNAEKVFVVEGVRVAALDRTGRLRVAGEVVEQGLAVRAMSAAIEHDSGLHRLYCGVGSPSDGYSAVFAFDINGRLLLRGAARERADLTSLTIDACHRAEPTRFLFSCDLTTVVLDYESGPDRLDLAGEVVENSPL